MTQRISLSRVAGYYRRHAASMMFRKPLLVRATQPLVSFTFDDFPRSALQNGGAILNRFGLAGTYYAALGLLGKQTESGAIFIEEDLASLLKQGHELGCHTFAHSDSWDTPAAEFEQSIVDNAAALNRLVPGAEFETFSYPINLPRPLTKAKIADRFRSCRGRDRLSTPAKLILISCRRTFWKRAGTIFKP